MSPKCAWILVPLLLCAAPSAHAQTIAIERFTYGVRVGVSADPTQFVFGGHMETRPLTRNITFRPNLEIGLGDRVSTVTANFEFVYWIPISSKPVRLYVGGGPALVINDFHDDHPNGSDTDVGGGFNLVAGLQHRRGLFGEIKVGFIDSPGFKFTVGYVF